MKITYDDKVHSYGHGKQGGNLKRLSKKYEINLSNIRYLNPKNLKELKDRNEALQRKR